MNNDFRLKFLSIVIALSLACFPYAQAESAEVWQKRKTGHQESKGPFSSQLSELAQENKTLEARIKALDKAKAKLERTIVKKEAAAKYIQDKLTQVSAKKNKFKKQIKALRADCANMRKELKRLNTSYDLVKERNRTLAKKLRALDKARGGPEAELAGKTASIGDLQARLEQSISEKNTLKGQIITLKDEQRRLKSEIGELNNDLELTMKKNTALNEELETFWGTIKDSLKNQMLALTDERAKLENELSAADKNYKLAQGEITSLKGDLEALGKVKVKLESGFTRKEAEIKGLQAELIRAGSEGRDLKKQIKVLENELSATDKNYKLAQGEITLLKEDLGVLDKANDELRSFLSDNETKIKDMENRLVQAGSEKANFQKQLKSAESERDNLKGEFEALSGDYKLAKEEAGDLKIELKALGKGKARLESELVGKTASIGNLQAKLEQYISQRISLKKQLQDLEKKYSRLEGDCPNRRALKEQVSNLSKAQKRVEQENRTLNKDLALLEKAKAALELELDKSKALARKAQDKLVKIVPERENLKKRLKALENRFKALDNDLNSAKGLNTSLKSTLSKEEDKVRGLEAGLAKVSSETNTLQKQLKTLSVKKSSTISKLETKLTEVTSDRDSLKKRAKSAEEDRDNLKSEFTRLNEYYKTTKEENFALKKELKDSQLAYIREVNSSSNIIKEKEQLADELVREIQSREELGKKWKEINKELVLLRKSTPAGRKEKKETLAKIYGNLAMRGSKFSKEELAKDKEKIYQALGYVYLLDGDFKKAIAFYKKALKINLSAKDVHYNLGYLYTQIGKYKLAVNSYRKALKGDKSDEDIYYNLALIYGKYLHNEEKSTEYYEKISEK